MRSREPAIPGRVATNLCPRKRWERRAQIWMPMKLFGNSLAGIRCHSLRQPTSNELIRAAPKENCDATYARVNEDLLTPGRCVTLRHASVGLNIEGFGIAIPGFGNLHTFCAEYMCVESPRPAVPVVGTHEVLHRPIESTRLYAQVEFMGKNANTPSKEIQRRSAQKKWAM